MYEFTKEELNKMSDEEIEVQISNHIYKAALIFEDLEHAGKFIGNGHHMAQHIAKLVVEIYRQRRKSNPDW
jgi:hypothetical protein